MYYELIDILLVSEKSLIIIETMGEKSFDRSGKTLIDERRKLYHHGLSE